jgi:DNA-binding GntR family transcriptional regulator
MAVAKPGVKPMRRMSNVQIADDLAARIRSGEYPPGTQLHYQQLAKLYDCPRSRIKQAMVRLSAWGLVEYVQGVGTFVGEPQ